MASLERIKRWGFDMGGRYQTGIAGQEYASWHIAELDSRTGKVTYKRRPVSRSKSEEIAIIKPWR